MGKKAKVAVLRTKPETVLEDYQKLFELADGKKALDSKATYLPSEEIDG
jgi:hypothetical protein